MKRILILLYVSMPGFVSGSQSHQSVEALDSSAPITPPVTVPARPMSSARVPTAGRSFFVSAIRAKEEVNKATRIQKKNDQKERNGVPKVPVVRAKLREIGNPQKNLQKKAECDLVESENEEPTRGRYGEDDIFCFDEEM